MAVKTDTYSPLAADTTRNPSSSIWGNYDPAVMISRGISPDGFSTEIWEDFVTIPSPSSAAAIGTLGQWATWMATGQTIVDGVQVGGVGKMDGTTANKSTILTSNAGSVLLVGATSTFVLYPSRFRMEIRLALGSVAASQQAVFFGLADNTGSQINSSDTTVITTGGNTLATTKNLIGVFNRTTTGPADFSAVFQPAAGTAVYPTNLTTLSATVAGAAMTAWAAGTDGQGTGYIKLGMVYDATPQNPAVLISSASSGQTAGVLKKPLIKFYVNGVPAAAFLSDTNLQAATFPTGCIFSPVFQYMNVAGSTAPIYVDWIRYGYGSPV